MINYSTSSLLYNEIESFSFPNQYLVLLLVILVVIFIVIMSSSVWIPSSYNHYTFVELMISLGSLAILVLIIGPSLTLPFESELIMVPSPIPSTIAYQRMRSFDLALTNLRHIFDVNIIPCSLLSELRSGCCVWWSERA